MTDITDKLTLEEGGFSYLSEEILDDIDYLSLNYKDLSKKINSRKGFITIKEKGEIKRLEGIAKAYEIKNAFCIEFIKDALTCVDIKYPDSHGGKSMLNYLLTEHEESGRQIREALNYLNSRSNLMKLFEKAGIFTYDIYEN